MKSCAALAVSGVCWFVAIFAALPARAAYIWVEGEHPTQSDVHRHPWWYDKVKKDQLSGGDLISNWSDDPQPGSLSYAIQAPKAGEYEFWVRANPVGTKLSFQVNDGNWTPIDMGKAQGVTNIADDDKPDLRFIAWIPAGRVTVKQGENTIRFRMESDNHKHGMIDCFVLSDQPFQPNGLAKPGEAAGAGVMPDAGFFAFTPESDPLKAGCPIDLRWLNEKMAGQGGFIGVKNGQFVHGRTGEPVRFWAVNGPPDKMEDVNDLRRCARILAKYGVNLVRIHAPFYDNQGNVEPAKVQHEIDIVEAMQAEGIYTDFSIFWYSFFRPAPNLSWLPGYDGNKASVAILYFDPEFQKKYFSWWQALLTTPGKRSGKRLIDNPAVASLEFCNEDSYFFWTFSDSNIPDPEMRIIETQFGTWLKRKYGSLDAAFQHWNGMRVARDNPAEGRVGFRPMWNLFNERSPRDQDTAEFLTQSQRNFYRQAYEALRKLGFKGTMTGSNWTTANPQYLGPLDKYTYTVCDYVDRHGYFNPNREGENAGWAIVPGQTYWDRSALRFDPQKPGSPKDFNNPVIDIHYDGKPSAISETAFERPNRYRSEAPLYYACYGALQDSNSIVHFALDSDRWSAKPGYFMQPWTLMSPAMMAQFPAAAMIYRKGLIATGDELVQLNLKIADLEHLAGTPMPQDASFDVLRAADVPKGTELKPGNVIDPLVHYAGRTSVRFTETGGPARLANLSRLVDRAHSTVTSSTGQLKLDYEHGILTLNAPAAQGVSGDLKDAGTVDLRTLSIQSDLPIGHIVAVSLDGKPLATSAKILLQVMTEEQPHGWQTEAIGQTQRVTSIGGDPWEVKEIAGTVKFKRPDASKLKVTPLDLNGYPMPETGSADAIHLRANAIYYLISR